MQTQWKGKCKQLETTVGASVRLHPLAQRSSIVEHFHKLLITVCMVFPSSVSIIQLSALARQSNFNLFLTHFPLTLIGSSVMDLIDLVTLFPFDCFN